MASLCNDNDVLKSIDNRKTAWDRHHKGFTLIEMLIALSILGLALTLFLPNFAPALDRTRLHASAREIASGLRLAQNRAMTSGQEVLFAVNIDRHSYQLVGDTRSRAIPAALGINVFTATNEITGDRVAQIRFYPDGTATGGRVRLSNKNQSSDIIVNWLTGGVEVRDVLEK